MSPTQNCKKCRIKIKTPAESCPLCGGMLDGENKNNEIVYPAVDTIHRMGQSLFTLLSKFVFLVLLAGTITGVIVNYLTYDGMLWSAIVFASAVDLYVLLNNLFFWRFSTVAKIFLQFICVIANVITVDQLSGSSGWGLNFVVPFTIVGATLILTVFAAVKVFRSGSMSLYILIMALMGFAPFVLYFCGLITVLWPSIAASGYSFLTIIGLFVFLKKKTVNELKRRFHI